MWTRERVVEHLNAGGTADYLLFWGHTPKQRGRRASVRVSYKLQDRQEIGGVARRTAARSSRARCASAEAWQDSLAAQEDPGAASSTEGARASPSTPASMAMPPSSRPDCGSADSLACPSGSKATAEIGAPIPQPAQDESAATASPLPPAVTNARENTSIEMHGYSKDSRSCDPAREAPS